MSKRRRAAMSEFAEDLVNVLTRLPINWQQAQAEANAKLLALIDAVLAGEELPEVTERQRPCPEDEPMKAKLLASIEREATALGSEGP
jgi:hypothetical protein